MSIKYGRIDHTETGFTEQDFHKNQTLKSSSLGVHHHFAKKDDQLAISKENGTVYRNFGGETPGFTKDII